MRYTMGKFLMTNAIVIKENHIYGSILRSGKMLYGKS